jgi:hypothetical protein
MGVQLFFRLALTLATLAPLVATSSASAADAPTPYRAFWSSSYWNTPLRADAPRDPNSDAMINFLKTDNLYPHIRLAGTEASGGWGEPVFWTQPSDPFYEVKSTRYTLPAEFKSIRIPAGAQVAATADAQMTIYDLDVGAVYKLWAATFDPLTNTWSAGGGAYYYLGSNGLNGTLAESDERRNRGHRGIPPSTHTVRYDEIKAGQIDHVLKVSINTARTDYVWPMVGSDGSTTNVNAPPQGARFRIKPSVDLSTLGLSPPALVIAKALQKHGAMVGDSSGAAVSLKVENTVREGRGWLWNGVLAVDSLRSIPFDMFEFVQLGYKPPAGDVLPLPEPTPTTSPSPTPTVAPSPTPTVEPSPAPVPDPSPTVAPPTVQPTTVEMAPVADTFIDSRYPTANVGTRDRMRVLGGSRQMHGMVGFDMSRVTGTVTSARLRLTSQNSSTVGVKLQPVVGAWSERTVTWANAPAASPTVLFSGAITRSKPFEVNVTPYVSSGMTSFYVKTDSSTVIGFGTKEGTASLAPKLVVTTVP